MIIFLSVNAALYFYDNSAMNERTSLQLLFIGSWPNMCILEFPEWEYDGFCRLRKRFYAYGVTCAERKAECIWCASAIIVIIALWFIVWRWPYWGSLTCWSICDMLNYTNDIMISECQMKLFYCRKIPIDSNLFAIIECGEGKSISDFYKFTSKRHCMLMEVIAIPFSNLCFYGFTVWLTIGIGALLNTYVIMYQGKKRITPICILIGIVFISPLLSRWL